MRKLSLLTVGVLALAVCGLAVGTGFTSVKTAKTVAGTFTATTASQVETRTCTTTDGKTIAISHGKYTGVAIGLTAGDADLSGPITLDVHSAINTTDNVGAVRGRLKIDVASGEDTVAHFDAVYDHGNVAGLASGHAHRPYAALLANLSAGYSTAGGFTSGKLGGATAGGSAVELGPGRCAPNHPPKQVSAARGSITDVSATSISVAGLTCSVPASLAAKVGTLKTGDTVEIHCTLLGSTNTLVRVELRHR